MKLIPHPAVQILVWLLLALLAQRLQSFALLILSGALIGIALKLSAVQLLRLLRRTRWILFSLLLIYAYTTPGAAVWTALGAASPTREGLLDGLLQLGRLLSVLSGLAILLELLPQAKLISGLYALFYPLQWFGLSRERIAVRLALTLEYAESAMSDTAKDWRTTINVALRPAAAGTAHIELSLQKFGVVDVLSLLLSTVVLIGLWR
jgi:energy-coupling factor transport system permease protein